MAQSLARIVVHTIFSTKARTPNITPEIQPKLNAYLAGALNELGATPLVVGGYTDHVHLLHLMSKTRTISETVEEVKKSSSKWMKQSVPDFYWQSGYGSFSISQSAVPTVTHYIQNQADHHAKLSFKEELLALFEEHGVSYDERYLWD